MPWCSLGTHTCTVSLQYVIVDESSSFPVVSKPCDSPQTIIQKVEFYNCILNERIVCKS